MFVVTVNPYAMTAGYYGPQLFADGDWYEMTEKYLVIYAAHGPDDIRGGRRSVLVLPVDDVLALDEV